jgi:hypothetical protein
VGSSPTRPTKHKFIVYYPLPASLTIKESTIHGIGLFAIEVIPEGINLGVSHYFSTMHNELIRTPLGGFYNHSDDPNCYSLITTEFAELITLRDINAGEELTTFYSINPLPHP